jgi:exopolysaccharide production protein ExoQ
MQVLTCNPFLASLIGLPPQLVLLVILGGIFYLFRRDFRQKPNVTSAIWLPIVWLLIIASRPVTQWLAIFGVPIGGTISLEEGSSLDALVFLGLIASGVYVLRNRGIKLHDVVKENRWLMAFFLYCFLAIFWSDYPVVSFKRWIKILGHPIMVLILFTEPDPREALITFMKRCAYVLFPVSVLWIKYFPYLGRKSGDYGEMTNRGIAGDKNALGAVCLVLGLCLLWHWLQVMRTEKTRSRRDELRLTGFLLLIIGYCLRKAHSSTSTISFLLAALIMVCLGLRFVNKRQVGLYVLGGAILFALAQVTFDVYGSIVDLTGHGATIEGRGRLWQYLLESNTSPVLGTGFESYWLGDRIDNIWAQPEFRWHPVQAHNGYLETYVNLGAVGLCMLVGVILVTFWKCQQQLVRNFEWGRLTMSYLVAILAHNWTEAGFKGLSVMYFAFFFVAIDYAQRRIDIVPRPIDTVGLEEELELVHTE